MPAKFDTRRLYADAARLVTTPKKLTTAQQRAAATLRRRLGPEATRDIGAELNLTAARIRKGLSTRSTSNTVELTGSGAALGIAQAFGGRQTPAGVVVTVKRTAPPVRFKHGFIRTPRGSRAKSGPQAFERRGPRAPRLPVDRLFTTTLAGSLRSPQRVDRLGEFSLDTLAAEVRRQLGIR